MSNPILRELSTEGIIKSEQSDVYKLANLLKFSEPEIIPTIEAYENGIDLKFQIKEYLKRGLKIYKTCKKEGKEEKIFKRVNIEGKRFFASEVIEEIDKRELELKYAVIKLINKEEKIGMKEDSENGFSLNLNFVLELEELPSLILTIELLEKVGYDLSNKKEKILYGLNERFYIKDLWNGNISYIGDVENKKTKKIRSIIQFADRTKIETENFEKELIDRRDLAKATIIQAISKSGDLIEASGKKEVEYGK